MSIRVVVMSTYIGPVIEARRLGKSFKDLVAVHDVSFSIDRGRIFGLLGPNGAGKTTLVKMLTTLISIDRGGAAVAGHDVAGDPDAVRRVIGLAGQVAAVDEKLSARENLALFARLYKIPRRQRRRRIDELVERFGMAEFADRLASTYSGGQRRRLDIVAALVAEPMALFLDEPTTGLDPRSRADVWDAIRVLAAEGTAILLTTQYLEEADRLADELVVIDRGRTVATGSPELLKHQLGRDVLEVHMATDTDFAAADSTLGAVEGKLGDPSSRQIDVPITTGATQSLDLLRRLEDRGVAISDFRLRRPTLDDVFLALTGNRPTDGGHDSP